MKSSTQDNAEGKGHQVKGKIKEAATVLLFAVAMLLAGCVARQPVQPLPGFTLAPFDSGRYVSSVDNFLILLDASSSMDESYKGNEKFAIAREVVRRLNRTLPELDQNSGLRSFGHSQVVSKKLTVLFYGMETYSTSALNGKLDLISEPGGSTPMYAAMIQAREDLKSVTGKTAVVIVSDGKELAPETQATAEALKEQLGSGACFYPILVGDNVKGKSIMEKIAQAGKCGFASDADALLTNEGMGRFVKDVFLSRKTMGAATKAAPEDSDNDGVTDDRDQCPDTQPGTAVDMNGCPPAAEKKTSMTDVKPVPPPPGTMLKVQDVWVKDEVLFDFDESTIKPGGFVFLDKVAGILKASPGMSVNLNGHTDNIGSAAYNDALSLRRAQSVKTYLAGKGIDKNRLSCKGFGFSRPAASDKTDKGRALNRRVELYPAK